uniref:Oikosin 10 n=1 Tax=Oikopleura dioica TaxID=34765 RepID=W6JXA4_OIKDI|nr:oikosin 10 [Oikopleura dioica]
MKLASTLFGVILAQQEGSTPVDEYEDYGEDAERGKLKKQQQQGYSEPTYNYQSYETPTYQYSDNSYYGKTGTTVTVTAVTCWESNHMGSHATNPDGHSHEGVAPGITDYDNRDNYGWLNIHENHDTTGTDANAHSLDAFDHRLSGCIYEGSGFIYGADTYDHYWDVAYSKTTLSPVWWHYFNAHVLPGGDKEDHKIVMANPTYEGLGYVNFIITFVAVDNAAAFIGADLAGTYINTHEGYHTDLYAAASDITIAISATEWYSTLDDGTDWIEKVAISSFPQNDLGKDFRFNIRILHKMGEADQVEAIDSYYWYKVNKVTITFPATVGCHWDSMDANTPTHGYFRCMDSASGPAVDAGTTEPQGGHMSWVSDDDGHTDSTHRTFHESFTTAVTTGGCSSSYDEQKMACGTVYEVKGLMNTYDEYAQQEYGTHQEFWFQFNYYYAYSTPLQNKCDNYEDFDCYQAPNMLFNAFEVSSIELQCNTDDLYAHNGNKCTKTGTLAKSVETWS